MFCTSNKLDVNLAVVKLSSMHNFLCTCSGLFGIEFDHAISFANLALVFGNMALVNSSKVLERLSQLETVDRVGQVLNAYGVSGRGGASTLVLFDLFTSLNYEGCSWTSHLVVRVTHLWLLGLAVVVALVVVAAWSTLLQPGIGREVSAVSAGEDLVSVVLVTTRVVVIVVTYGRTTATTSWASSGLVILGRHIITGCLSAVIPFVRVVGILVIAGLILGRVRSTVLLLVVLPAVVADSGEWV
jgi:hypothetical protein